MTGATGDVASCTRSVRGPPAPMATAVVSVPTSAGKLDERLDDQRGGEDERGSGGHEAAPAGPVMADVHGHLRRVGTGDQMRGADEVDELLLLHPPTMGDDFIVHHRDVRSGLAERDAPQLAEQTGQLVQPPRGAIRR